MDTLKIDNFGSLRYPMILLRLCKTEWSTLFSSMRKPKTSPSMTESKRILKESPSGVTTGSPFHRSGKIPLYHQLASWLEQKLRSGEYSDGAKIPGDTQLATELGVSIITVRAAMKVLIGKHLIARYPGKGTFVLENNSVRARAVWGLGSIEDLIAIGFRSSIKLLDMGHVIAPPWVAAKFSQPERKKIFWCQTLRLSNGEPFVITDVYLPTNIGEAIKKINLYKTLKKKRLVSTIVEETCGIFIADIHQTMGAELAKSQTAKILKVPEGTPLLTVERYYFTSDGTSVQVGRSSHRVDHYKYSINLKRVISG